MSSPESQRDDRLVDLLDEALTALRHGKDPDPAAWRQLDPTWADEGLQLLDTLRDLVHVAEDWRQIAAAFTPGPATADYVASTPEPDGAPCPTDTAAREGGEALERIGRYLVLSHLGTGGMATVYKAWDPQLQRLVAVKVPRRDPARPGHRTFVQRFLREARAAAAVRHPHVCPLYDVGEEDGMPYVVMAFIEGESLAQRLRRCGPFPDAAQAVQLCRQIAEALAAVHAHGIIHRDLKPGNILLDAGGQALVTDFGLAFSPEAEGRLTRTGVIVGTPAYMAPEQALGDPSRLGPAADLFSLGVVLYEMLTGQTPFAGGSTSEVLDRVRNETPASPLLPRPDLDPALAEIVLRALAKEPAQRFPGVQAFADALGDWLRKAPAKERPAAAPPGPVPRRRLSRRTVLITLALAAGMALLLAALALRGWLTGVTSPGSASSLTGELLVTISSDPEAGPVTKRRLPVDDPGALPVRSGELVHVEGRVNRPAYVYMIWIDSLGKVQPVYPWDVTNPKKLGWEAPSVPGGDEPQVEVHCPADRNRGLRVIGPTGLETVVMLVRTSPLPADKDLRTLVGELPPSRLTHRGEAVWLAQLPGQRAAVYERPSLNRGFEEGEPRKLDAPLLELLEQRLRPHFDLMKAVRFAHMAE
jgi:serine/threonine protein kinase